MRWMAMAGTVTMPSEYVVTLVGPEDCDAAEVLEAAVEQPLAVLPEAMAEAAMCGHTSRYRGSAMELFIQLQDAVEVHRDDPEALIQLWQGISTLRYGLFGDALRVAGGLTVWDALETHLDGPWLVEASALARREPGPQPGEDAAAFLEMLCDDRVHGGSWWALPYLATMPLHAWAGDAAQAALEGTDPDVDLQSLSQAWWAIGSAHGVASVTADLRVEHLRLRDAVRERRASLDR